MNEIGVTGARGRLGSELVLMGCTPIDLDITKLSSDYDEYLNDFDIIINCASITDVDGCEIELFLESHKVNALGAYAVRNHFHGRMIQISTDYIFDGKKGPYAECGTIPIPINRYGYTKWYGEELLGQIGDRETCIVRTTILYGDHPKGDFVSAILDKLDAGEPFDVTKMLKGNPTYVPYLAEALLELCDRKTFPDVLNIVGEETLSRYDFAIMISNIFGKDNNLICPTRQTLFDGAKRPLKAGLKTKNAKKLGIPIYSVIDGLSALCEKLESGRE